MCHRRSSRESLKRKIQPIAVVAVIVVLIVFAYLGYFSGIVEDFSATGASLKSDVNARISITKLWTSGTS